MLFLEIAVFTCVATIILLIIFNILRVLTKMHNKPFHKKRLLIPIVACILVSLLSITTYFGCLIYSSSVDKKPILSDTTELTSFDGRVFLVNNTLNNTQYYTYAYNSNGDIIKNKIPKDNCRIRFSTKEKPSIKIYVQEPVNQNAKSSPFYIANSDNNYLITIPANSIEYLKE